MKIPYLLSYIQNINLIVSLFIIERPIILTQWNIFPKFAPLLNISRSINAIIISHFVTYRLIIMTQRNVFPNPPLRIFLGLHRPRTVFCARRWLIVKNSRNVSVDVTSTKEKLQLNQQITHLQLANWRSKWQKNQKPEIKLEK